jgi:hypothetical protein
VLWVPEAPQRAPELCDNLLVLLKEGCFLTHTASVQPKAWAQGFQGTRWTASPGFVSPFACPRLYGDRRSGALLSGSPLCGGGGLDTSGQRGWDVS